MNKKQLIEGFSKLDKEHRYQVLADALIEGKADIPLLKKFWFDKKMSKFSMDEVSENMVSHFFLPYSIAPNFKINDKIYFVPMVTEESSVVAAASSSAKFWFNKDGFTAHTISTLKIGQIHFNWPGTYDELAHFFPAIEKKLKESVAYFLVKMKKRGGGIKKIEFLDFTHVLENYFQIKVSFDTVDAMGANLINSCLEEMAKALKDAIHKLFTGARSHCDIIMSILSNHSPDCLVECSVQCRTDQLNISSQEFSSGEFADRFRKAVTIAEKDIYRAVTHNKGIFNGVDAVIIATGNDFRAVEAGGHAYAAKDGTYKSLTHLEIEDNIFTYTLRMPLAIGTTGGLTSSHPLARISLEILGNPTAPELMQIAAATGLANNFSAIRALITSGIQKGHMKFHLKKILNSLNANDIENKLTALHFKSRTVSYAEVEQFLNNLREHSIV